MGSLREFRETEFYGVTGALAEHSLAKLVRKKNPGEPGLFYSIAEASIGHVENRAFLLELRHHYHQQQSERDQQHAKADRARKEHARVTA